MIVNDDSSVLNEFEVSLTDDTRVAIYNWHMFILQATADFIQKPSTDIYALAFYIVAQLCW